MDMTQNKTIAGGTPAPNENGKWVPVDPNSVGFNVDQAPAGAKFQGTDGSVYCVGQSAPQYQSVASNANNAIPTPSSIVQMPPIVQPIALVPYTSQNQPMLQYDPYSRPVDPAVNAPKGPNYVRKPYRGVSLACFIIALVSGILLALLSVAVFKENDARAFCSSNGVDMFIALLSILGVKGFSSNYYDAKVAPFMMNGQWGNDGISTAVTVAVIVFTLAVIIISIVLLIKYIVKFAHKQNPRCVSILAILNIVLCIAIFGMLLSMSNAEVNAAERSENVSAFFQMNSTIYAGIGLIIAFLASVALLVLPLCCKKNAYMVEKTDDTKTYVLNSEPPMAR